MLKTISLYNLIAVLVVLLVLTPVLVLRSHDHLSAGGDGRHAFVSHTCSTLELHKDLHAGDTCFACLRANLFVASFPNADRILKLAPVAASLVAENLQPTEYDELTCPKRGPPPSHS